MEPVYGWLLTNVLVLGVAVQAGLVLLSLLLAVLLAKRLKPWLARYREYRHVGRGVVIAELLALSVIWLALLWLAMTVLGLSEQPNALLRTVSHYWPPGSRFISPRSSSAIPLGQAHPWAAWSLAALSILDLLEPTIAVLDAAAVSSATPGSRSTTSSDRRSHSPCCCPWRCT